MCEREEDGREGNKKKERRQVKKTADRKNESVSRAGLEKEESREREREMRLSVCA